MANAYGTSSMAKATPQDALSTASFVRERRDVIDARKGLLIRITPDSEILLTRDGKLLGKEEPFPEWSIVLGHWNDQPIAVVEAPCDDLSTARRAHHIRECLPLLNDAERGLVATAVEVLHWRRDHRFCGRCGSTMVMDEIEYAMHCKACGHACYPRLSPCIITLITHGDEILLARGPDFPTGRFSTLAGFIEPGEDAEQAVQREIREEVGIDVCDIVYQRSQSWPFPHSFMMGFTASAVSKDLTIDGVEIEAADWFSVDDLPELPPHGAISRWLIEQHIAKVKAKR